MSQITKTFEIGEPKHKIGPHRADNYYHVFFDPGNANPRARYGICTDKEAACEMKRVWGWEIHGWELDGSRIDRIIVQVQVPETDEESIYGGWHVSFPQKSDREGYTRNLQLTWNKLNNGKYAIGKT